MQISKTTTDKIIVGSNDVSFPDALSDSAPCGTAVLNGPCLCWKTITSPGYEGVLNVSSNSAPQQSLNQQPDCNASLAIKSDGNLTVAGDGKTAHALLISGGSSVDTISVIGDMFVSGQLIVVIKEDLHLDLLLQTHLQNHLI